MVENEQDFPSGLGVLVPDSPFQKPVLVWSIPPKKHRYTEHWVSLWQTTSEIGVSMEEQAKNKNMTLSDYRVRDWLLCTIGVGNYVLVNQTEIARELDLHRITVHESIKHLCEMQILVKGPKIGRSTSYMINPAFCFFGKLNNGVQQRRKTIKQFKVKVIQFDNTKNK